MKDRIYGLKKNVFFLGLTSLFNDFSSEMVLSVLPGFFISVLKSGAQSMGLVEGIAEAASNFIKIYSGKLSDRIQKRKIFATFGYTLSVATQPFYMFVQSVGGVVGLRLADRIGKGLRDAPRDALISLSIDEGEAGKSFGYHRAMDTIGAILGPLVAYFILRANPLGFNSVFMTAFFVGIIAIFSLSLVKEVRVIFEKKSETTNNYVFPLSFRIYLTSIFILSFGTLPIAILLFRTSDIGFAIASIPLFYMISNLAYAFFSIPAGKIADAIGARKIIFAGYLSLIAGYFVLDISYSLLPLIIGFLFIGLFSALTDGTQRAYVSNIIPKEHKGKAFGYMNAAVGFGLLFSGIIGGYLWQNFGDTFTLTAGSIVICVGLLIFSFTKIAPKNEKHPY